MKEQGLKPQDWMISKVPVLPPVFRPVSKMGDVALTSDMNYLYKDVIENARNFSDLKGDLSDRGLGDERLNIYNSVKAVYGLGQPISPENAAKGVKGAIRQVIGTSPKFGMFQSKVISKTLDTVGRSVTIADPNLDMDEIGIPEKVAWEMYKPYVTRGLVRQGYPAATAIKMIADKTEAARHVLDKVMQERPIIMDRAPTWHKFNFMAFTPHIVDSDTIHVSPLVDPAYNMDHDGDTVNLHVPSSERAVEQAKRIMRPSENLTSLTDLSTPRYLPSKEQIFGLYAATARVEDKPVKVFNTVSDAKRAYARGEIGMNDPVEILQR
jgi:DNA-directed RNA polymerase subunit beta'